MFLLETIIRTKFLLCFLKETIRLNCLNLFITCSIHTRFFNSILSYLFNFIFFILVLSFKFLIFLFVINFLNFNSFTSLCNGLLSYVPFFKKSFAFFKNVYSFKKAKLFKTITICNYCIIFIT